MDDNDDEKEEESETRQKQRVSEQRRSVGWSSSVSAAAVRTRKSTGDDRASSWRNSRTTSAVVKSPAITSTSQLRHSIVPASLVRHINADPFEDPAHTYQPISSKVVVYSDATVMLISSYTGIPRIHNFAYLDGVSTKAMLNTIIITSPEGRKINGITPPTRLDQNMSIEEIARTVSKGVLGLLLTTGGVGGSQREGLSSSGGGEEKKIEGTTSIENNFRTIYGNVMPNSIEGGTTMLTRGSLIHIPDDPKNILVFPHANVDHRILVELSNEEGNIDVSYFTGGIAISLDAVIVLSELPPPAVTKKVKALAVEAGDPNIRALRKYDGNMAVYVHSENNTATKIVASTLLLSMTEVRHARDYPQREARGVMSFKKQEESMAGPSASDEPGGMIPSSIGPIDTFEYTHPVTIPTGTKNTLVMTSEVDISWMLRYDMENTYVDKPTIYVKILATDEDIPPLNATFLLEKMRVGGTRIRRTLRKGQGRFYYVGMDPMMEIYNTRSTPCENERPKDIQRTTDSDIKIVNRKSSAVSLVLYWNLQRSDITSVWMDVPPGAGKREETFLIEKLTIESPEFATKMSNTYKVLGVYFYDLPAGSVSLVKVTLHQFYPKPKHWESGYPRCTETIPE